jgi:hypothetical protein
MTQVTIPARFNGPARSANGGYACGVLASFVGGPARVRLHHPPPLDRVMTVQPGEAEREVVLTHGRRVIATARPGEPAGEVPPAPSLVEAAAALADARGRVWARAEHVWIERPPGSPVPTPG